MIKSVFHFAICFLLFTIHSKGVEPKSYPEKTRILILTDIENEPDDAMSLVRFLLYSNQFDVEGIV
ncbi:MAG TPA: nucleoside hydrolase-like domain-containing protein, partial [Draconibacterium sp.]|nr:nucleoside hydrolase-like domain-containing protein [Draconibacterium sp.]